jgi:cytidylate kinase
MTSNIHMIAIDGPVAAGKTVVGRTLAETLGYSFIDTGVMYRAITWLALNNGASIEEPESLGRLAVSNPVQLVNGDSSTVRIGGHEVGSELRTPRVEDHVSAVSSVSQVRAALVARQRELTIQRSIVMTGRDIGTVVLPGADLKVYLMASPERRARRRWQEQRERGDEVEFDDVLAETKRRDRIDSDRVDSPLRPANDAWLLDTDRLTVAEVVDCIVARMEGLR